MKRLAGFASLLLVPLTIIACGGKSENGPINSTVSVGANIDIRGEVTLLQTPAPDITLGALRVEGEVQPDTTYERAIIRLKENTVYLRKEGAGTVPATPADLRLGGHVEVKFVGVVAELDPVQASAGEVTILD
jgi:hypothetical protein